MEFISERVENISELEKHIRKAYYAVDKARYETTVRKDRTSIETIDVLLKEAQLELLQAKDFEFCIARRREKEED